MQYTVKKSDGTEMSFRSRDDFVGAYNLRDIDASWFAKTEEASEWGPAWELLGLPRPASADAIKPPPAADAKAGSTSVSEAVRRAATGRYRDAYRVATATVGIGLALKVLAIGLAGLCVIAAVAGISKSIANELTPSAGPLVIGLLEAAAVGVPLYVLGILVSAVGQVLKATLDTAVHTSPFLDTNQKAQIFIGY